MIAAKIEALIFGENLKINDRMHPSSAYDLALPVKYKL